MRYNTLGSSSLVVSEIALGCAQFSDQFTKTRKTEADMIAIMHHALACGITLWDTAPSYGDGYSETMVGRALKGRRERVVLATKITYGHTSPEMVRRSCEESLRRLDTDYIDLLQVHWPSDKEENYMTVATIAMLIKEGKVRAAGVSNFNIAQTEEALCVCPIASNQLPYALVWRYDEPLFEFCGRNNVSVLAYSPLGEGILTGRYDETTTFPPGDVRNHCVFFRPQVMPRALKVTAAVRQVAEKHGVTPAQVAINWVARQPHITSTIVGSSSLEQVTQNAAAVAWEMDDEDRALLRAASDDYHATAPRFAHMWDE